MLRGTPGYPGEPRVTSRVFRDTSSTQALELELELELVLEPSVLGGSPGVPERGEGGGALYPKVPRGAPRYPGVSRGPPGLLAWFSGMPQDKEGPYGMRGAVVMCNATIMHMHYGFISVSAKAFISELL